MSIVRIQRHENPYVQLDRAPLRLTTLSWAAKGLWAYLVSLPDNWEPNVNHLAKEFGGAKGRGQGKDAIYGYFKELKEHGLADLLITRDKGRIIRKEWVIYEVYNEVSPNRDNPDLVKPDLAEPDQVKPDTKEDKRVRRLELEEEEKEEKKGGAPPNPPPTCDPVLSFGQDGIVKLTQKQYDKLAEAILDLDGLIEEINDYVASKGKKPYKDYAATIRSWHRRREKDAAEKTKQAGRQRGISAWGAEYDNQPQYQWG